MNLAVKTLESIGQNSSIKQHNNISEMLNHLNIKNDVYIETKDINKEFVCALLPADDEDSDDQNEEE